MSQQFMPNMNTKHLEVISGDKQMTSDDIVLTQAILPLLFHWKSRKANHKKIKKIKFTQRA
jgi:hypothetical protein